MDSNSGRSSSPSQRSRSEYGIESIWIGQQPVQPDDIVSTFLRVLLLRRVFFDRDVHLDAVTLELGLNQFRDALNLSWERKVDHLHLLTVFGPHPVRSLFPSSVVEELLTFLRIVVVPAIWWAPVESITLLPDTLRCSMNAAVDRFDNPSTVDPVAQRLADLGVIGWCLSYVEHQQRRETLHRR